MGGGRHASFWAAFEDDLIAYILVTKGLKVFTGTGRLQTGTPHGYGRQIHTERKNQIRSDHSYKVLGACHIGPVRCQPTRQPCFKLSNRREEEWVSRLQFLGSGSCFLRERAPSSPTSNITCLLTGSKRGKKDTSNKGKFGIIRADLLDFRTSVVGVVE